jgi:hypothetical protein
MAFDFPSSPVLGQEFTSGTSVYVWNGYGWMSKPAPEFVDETGDTMTGALTIRMSGTTGHLLLDNPTINDVVAIALKKNNKFRWTLNATAGPEPGAQVGSNFSIRRYDDAGTLLSDTPLNINRATGRAQVGQQPVDPNDIATKAYVDTTFGGGGPGYLPLTGGTLTGNLTAPNYYLNAPGGSQADIWGQLAGSVRWLIRLTDNFELHRYSDAAAYLGSPFSISRATGDVNIAQALGVVGTIFGGSISSPSGTFTNANVTNMTSSGTFSLTTVSCNGLTANAIVDNGALTVNGGSTLQAVTATNVTCSGSVTAGAEYQSSRGDALIVFRAFGGAAGVVRFDSNGEIVPDYGFACKPGVWALARPHAFNVDFNGGAAGVWIDATFQGNFAYTSDYRIKKDVAPLVTVWDKIKALKPISYTLQDYDPPSAIKAPEGEEPRPPMYPGDDIERWGFLAHELQETLIPSAATGEKDSPNIIQSPNPWTIIAALTKTLQEAMVRIELLESKVR